MFSVLLSFFVIASSQSQLEGFGMVPMNGEKWGKLMNVINSHEEMKKETLKTALKMLEKHNLLHDFTKDVAAATHRYD